MRFAFSPYATRNCILAAGLLFHPALGCQEQETIRDAKEPKPDFERPFVEGEHTERFAILGGIAPAGDGSQFWFFKLSGPVDLVRKERANFDAFIASLKFDPLAERDWRWQTPPSWAELRGDGVRMASFRMGDAYARETAVGAAIGSAGFLALLDRVEASYNQFYPELTITMSGGALIENVNRWRDQLGLPKFQMNDLNRALQMRQVGNAVVFVVDMAGPILKGPPRGPFQNPH